MSFSPFGTNRELYRINQENKVRAYNQFKNGMSLIEVAEANGISRSCAAGRIRAGKMQAQYNEVISFRYRTLLVETVCEVCPDIEKPLPIGRQEHLNHSFGI